MPPPPTWDLSEEQCKFLETKTEGIYSFALGKWRHIFLGDTQGGGHFWWTSRHANGAEPPTWAQEHPDEPFQVAGRGYFPLRFDMTEMTLYIFFVAVKAGIAKGNPYLMPPPWKNGYCLEVWGTGNRINTAVPKRKNRQPLQVCMPNTVQIGSASKEEAKDK